MRIVLDTGVFFRPSALAETLATRRPVVLPTLVVAERRRQLIRDARNLASLERAVNESGYWIESFGLDEALRMPALTDATWARHARDAMIAAHVREGDVLWTTNPRDFLALGMRPEQVRGV